VKKKTSKKAVVTGGRSPSGKGKESKVKKIMKYLKSVARKTSKKKKSSSKKKSK
jgi:hypothetical protein